MGSRHHSRKKQCPPPANSQVPHKFAVDERVLCYEPDLKKARVLYDSKVLQVVERPNNRGKITVEYKIHFFGWNSSWDRYVAEDCVLKDTDENRQLQKELKAKADILLQSHLKKKKRKKTLSEILKEATKAKSGKLPKSNAKNGNRNEGGRRANPQNSDSSSSESESSEDEVETVAHILLTDPVRSILERDFYNILGHKLLVRTPADITVVFVFEEYVKFYGFRELKKILQKWKPTFDSGNFPPTAATSSSNCSWMKLSAKYPARRDMKPLPDPFLEDIAKIYRKVRQAQEIVYGLKTIFDYMLYQMLLYDRENEQYKSYKRMRPIMPVIDCIRMLPRYKVAKQAEQNVPKTGVSKGARPMQDGMPSGTSSKHHCNTNAQSSMPPSTANLPFRIPPRPQSPTITNIPFIMPPIPQPPTSASIPFTMPPLPKLPTVNQFPTPPRPQASTSANVSTTIPLRPQTSTAANAPQASTSTHNAPPNLQPQASTSSANAPTNMPPQVSKSRVDAPKKIPQHESTFTKNPPPDLTSTENVIPKILEASLPNANAPVQEPTTSAAVQESSPIREPTSIAEVQESCPVQEPTASVAVQESSPAEEPAQVPTANAPVQGSTANTASKMAPEASTSTENASPKLLPQPQASTSTHNAPLKMPLLEPSISTANTPPAMLPLPSPSPTSNPSSIMPPPPPKPSTSAVIPSSTMQPKPSTSSAKHTYTLPPPRPSTSTAKHTYRMSQPKPSTSTAKHTYSRPPPPSMPSTSRVPPNFQIPNEVETISILPPNITNAQTDPQVVWTRKAEQYAKDLSSWRILPAECYAQGQPDPSMVYGLIHLLRLFVKLPDILNRTLIPRRKVRIIAHHVNMMSEHIQDTYAFPVHRLYVRVPRSKTYEEDQIGFGAVTSEEEKHPNRNVQKETDLSQYHTRSYRTEVPDRAVPMLPKVVQVPLSSTSNAVEEHKLTVSNHCMEDTVEICVENQVMETSEAPNPEANENNDVVMTEPIDQGSVTVLVPTVNDEAKDKNEELTKTSIKIETNVSHQTKRKLEVKAQREPTPPFEPMVRKVRKSAADAAFKTAHIFNSIPMAPRVVIPRREVIKTESRSTPVVKKRARSGGSPSRNPDPKRIMRISEREKEEKSSKVVVKTENTGSVNQKSWGRNSRQTHRSSITTEKNVSRSPQRGINRGTATPVIKLEKLQKEDQNPGTSGTKRSSTQKDETDKRPTTDNSRRVSPSSSNRCNQFGDRKLFSPKKMHSVPKPNPSPRTSKSNSTHRESGSPCKSPQKSGAPPSTTLRLRSRSDERQLRSKGQLINALSLPTIAPRSSLGPKSKDRSPTRRESSGHRESCSSSSNTISVKREDSSPALRRRKR